MRCGALTTPFRLQVGLDHKNADEQTFTEYCPHTFQALVFKQHPDPGEWARSPLTVWSHARVFGMIAWLRPCASAEVQPKEATEKGRTCQDLAHARADRTRLL